jgi:pimeloyl-ACP methyl ester carboxylesterase
VATIEVNDISIYYERDGVGSSLVFIHGMCGDADVWADQARRVADEYTCVRYDRRGHTRSARGLAEISDALHAEDAAALIEALDLAPCVVVSSSGGAVVAVELALRHPHLLRGVVLSEPPLFSINPDAGRALMCELVPRLEEATTSGGPRAGVDAFFSCVCPGLWSTIDDAAKDRYRANAEIGFADLRSPRSEIVLADVANVDVPALVITGSRSHPSFRAVASDLGAAWTDVRVVELEGSGHVTYAERPDAFAEAVAAFLAELDRREVVAR